MEEKEKVLEIEYKQPEQNDSVRKEIIKHMAYLHCTDEEMATRFSLNVETLYRKYGRLIEEQRAVGKSSLRALQWKIAEEKMSAHMAIALGREILGQGQGATPYNIKPLILMSQNIEKLRARQAEERAKEAEETLDIEKEGIDESGNS